MTIAVIGGSGFSALGDFQVYQEIQCAGPYGSPSDGILEGNYSGQSIYFLARHGSSHSIPPHRVNYRANIHALRELGVTHIVALFAVGGIGTALVPGSVAVPDQLIDYTSSREATFFDGLSSGDTDRDSHVSHAEFTSPFCPQMREAALKVARESQIEVIGSGTYAATQGPRLETAAEIRRLARDGADMVGMTAMPEAGLAREAGICYLGLAMTVNYAAGIVSDVITAGQLASASAEAGDSVCRMLPALLEITSELECNTPDPITV